jgi:pullulanase
MSNLPLRIVTIIAGTMLSCLLLPEAAAAPTSGNAPFNVPIFLRGSFNYWGACNEMNLDKGTNTYHATLALNSGDFYFKIASLDWNTVDLGYAEGVSDGIVQLGVDEAMAQDSYNLPNWPHNLRIYIPETAAYSFSLNAADPNHLSVLAMTAHKIGVVPPKAKSPWCVPLFVRGSFNDWGATDELTYRGATRDFVTKVQLTAGDYLFKIASQDWTAVDLGYAWGVADGIVQLGINEVMAPENYSLPGAPHNLWINIASDGVYLFVLNVSDPNYPSLVVTWFHPEPHAPQE